MGLPFYVNTTTTTVKRELNMKDSSMAWQDQLTDSRNASENKFITWLETTGLLEYANMFTENGYDDLQLLKGMEEVKVKDMIEVLGIKSKGIS